MNYYIDTEFYEDGKQIHLISIGILSEDGREFYAENTKFDWSAVPDDHLIHGDVRPRLKYDGRLDHDDTFEVIHLSKYKTHIIGTSDFIKGHVLRFIGNDRPVFYGYFADYDWVVFCQLFGRMVDLPKGFPCYCRDLKQTMDELGLDGDWKKANCPDPVNEHNALANARWNMNLHMAITNRDINKESA